MKPDKLAIIILNYNGLPYILDCFNSLSRINKPKNLQIEAWLIDNGSVDKSLCQIKKNFPWVRVFENRKNLGFAKGNNVGLKKALKEKFNYILLLNPDTIVRPDFLTPLIKLLRKDWATGIAAPVLKDNKGLALGAKFNPFLGRTKHLRLDIKTGSLCPLEQEIVSGCAMLVRREVLEKIGLLDERFFLYFEDADFCLRARQAGFKIYVHPQSVVEHKISLSLKGWQKIKYNLRSNFLFILKRVKLIYWPLAFGYLFCLGVKMIVSFKRAEK